VFDGDGDAGRSGLEGFLFRIEVVMDLFDLVELELHWINPMLRPSSTKINRLM